MFGCPRGNFKREAERIKETLPSRSLRFVFKGEFHRLQQHGSAHRPRGSPKGDACKTVRKAIGLKGLEPHIYYLDEYELVKDTLEEREVS